MQNFFNLFGLEAKFDIDLAKLETSYRAIQSASHPDRFVTASDAEKLAAMQTATTANEAYKTLKHPTLRGTYLLGLQSIDVEAQRAMPAEFLMQQMEWREAVEDNANNLSTLHQLQREIKTEVATLQSTLANEIDKAHAWQQAAETVRKLQFMDKLREEINHKIQALED